MELLISAVLFMDDYEMKPEPNEKFVYKQGDMFVTIIRNNEIVELVNVSVIRSMEVQK